jgi:hypothetical protein
MLVDVLCASLVKRQIPVTEAERDVVVNVLDPQGVLSELHVVIA